MARDHKRVLQELAALSRLPELLREFDKIKEMFENLYEKTAKND
jgi:hypothetical protein